MSYTHQSGDSNDRENWEEIYKNHSPVLFGYLVRKVGHDLASDILQESFLRFMQMVEKKKKIENARAYLFQIARNLLNREYSRNYFAGSADLPANFEDHNSYVEADFYKKELRGLLESAKRTLSPYELEIFELRWLMNFTQVEIANVVSRSERQIRRDLEKITRKIREVFQKAGWGLEDMENGR